MEALVDIKFDELLKIVKSLPENKLFQLKAEIEKNVRQDDNRNDFRALLLNGPIFSKKQLDNIAKTTKAINNQLVHFFVMSGSDDISKFWGVVQMLFNQHIIRENKHFMLANGYLYIHVQDIHPYYTEALQKRKDANVLDKPSLYKCLESDTKSFVARKKKSFGGTYRWCHQFIYAELSINLLSLDEISN